ncbi:MAG: 2-phospho-L-lactate guanylyltransferase [Spongiibacteraceae bacterium]
MLAQALVPIKSLIAAKSRLSRVLSPVERRDLALAMTEHVLSTLANHPDISAVTLVSDDPAVAALARKYGMNYWLESALGCSGLNAAIAHSCDVLFTQSSQPVVVLHSDLPCLEASDISTVLKHLQQKEGLVIVADRYGLGTNLLAFGAESRPEFSFGADSFSRHCTSAKKLGISVKVLRLAGVALDIDEPQDLELWMKRTKRKSENNVKPTSLSIAVCQQGAFMRQRYNG